MDGQRGQKDFSGQEVGETRELRKAIELGLRAATGYRQLPTVKLDSHSPTPANHSNGPFLLYGGTIIQVPTKSPGEHIVRPAGLLNEG